MPVFRPRVTRPARETGPPPAPRNFWLLAALVFAAFLLFRRIVDFLGDWYWFEEIGLRHVLLTRVGAGVALFAGAGLLSWLFLRVNLRIARGATRQVVYPPGGEILEILPLRQVREGALRVFEILAAIVSFLLAIAAAGRWLTLLRGLQATPFGAADPLFGRDLGWFVFHLPAWRAILSLVVAPVVAATLLAGAVYFLHGAVWITPRSLRLSREARVHLGVLGGVLCLLAAVHFHLSMYELVHLHRPITSGAGYTGVRVTMPALGALRVVALLAALLFWAAVRYPRPRLLVAAVALILGGPLLASLAAGAVQRLRVSPNEIALERPYIEWGIRMTRAAYGIETVEELPFAPSGTLDRAALDRNAGTLENVRLWDYQPLLVTYSQLQEIRTYYQFLDADNDRYTVNGTYRQVMLSARELVSSSIPSRIWINEHLTYTHGYGLCMGPVNRITSEGLPEFFVKDIPPASPAGIAVSRPEIYYGEAANGYAIVKTRAQEFDYPSGDENVYSVYAGRGGVPIGNPLRRLLFAFLFREPKILLSTDLTNESRVLYHRQILARVGRAAPFLSLDADPYLVVRDDGRLAWIIDAYTTTERYPYSATTRGIGNYIRNSVKILVDAYDGSIRWFAFDPADPVLATYARIFPRMFEPLASMPDDVRRHLRYPQTLFRTQADIYATYHMTDPQVFYNKEDLWRIPLRKAGDRPVLMEPYYTVMRLATVGVREEFLLMIPFTPLRKENMIAWMAARCDGDEYGKLLVFEFPKQELVYGPSQIESRIDQDPVISSQLTLWGQRGSSVIRGSLLVIPIESSLLYFQPLYLEAQGGGLPELKRVIVAFGNRIAMEETLEASLARVFGSSAAAPAGEGVAAGAPGGAGRAAAGPGAGVPGEGAPDGAETARLIREADDGYRRAHELLRSGDWEGYGREMKRVGEILERLAASGRR